MAEAARLLKVSSVGFSMNGRQILENIELQVEENEIVTLIGPNGAGKTTLLRVALGLLKPSTGSVWQQPGLRIGYMPQKLLPDRTFPLDVKRFLSLTEKSYRPRIPEVLHEVGGEHLLNSSLASLSGGELQRILLARALLRDPHLLVLDEPVQGVDIHGQVDLFKLITTLRQRRGCSVLLVSHDLHLVMASTQRVVCLNGHVCCTGTPEMVSKDKRFLELFGPSAMPHLALYMHDQTHQHNSCRGHHCDGPSFSGDRND